MEFVTFRQLKLSIKCVTCECQPGIASASASAAMQWLIKICDVWKLCAAIFTNFARHASKWRDDGV